jgi:hypothetical protein
VWRWNAIQVRRAESHEIRTRQGSHEDKCPASIQNDKSPIIRCAQSGRCIPDFNYRNRPQLMLYAKVTISPATTMQPRINATGTGSLSSICPQC